MSQHPIMRHLSRSARRANQLLIAEEFGQPPTDAKRLAGVISLAAVIGGPHPHPLKA